MSTRVGNVEITFVTGVSGKPVGTRIGKSAIPVKVDNKNIVTLPVGSFWGVDIYNDNDRSVELKLFIEGKKVHGVVYHPGKRYHPLRCGSDKREFQVTAVPKGSVGSGDTNNGLVKMEFYTRLTDEEALKLMADQLSEGKVKEFRESLALSGIFLRKTDTYAYLDALRKTETKVHEVYGEVLQHTGEHDIPSIFRKFLDQDAKDVPEHLFAALFKYMPDYLLKGKIVESIVLKFLPLLPEKENKRFVDKMYDEYGADEFENFFWGTTPAGASNVFVDCAKAKMRSERKKLQDKAAQNEFDSSDDEFHSWAYQGMDGFRGGFRGCFRGLDAPVTRSLDIPGGLSDESYNPYGNTFEAKTEFVVPQLGREQQFKSTNDFLKKLTHVIHFRILGEIPSVVPNVSKETLSSPPPTWAKLAEM